MQLLGYQFGVFIEYMLLYERACLEELLAGFAAVFAFILNLNVGFCQFGQFPVSHVSHANEVAIDDMPTLDNSRLRALWDRPTPYQSAMGSFHRSSSPSFAHSILSFCSCEVAAFEHDRRICGPVLQQSR